MQDGDPDMMHLMSNFESTALDRLTATRRQEGSLHPEVEEMLAIVGVFWDESDEEYFSVDAVLRQVEEETIKKYSKSPYIEE